MKQRSAEPRFPPGRWHTYPSSHHNRTTLLHAGPLAIASRSTAATVSYQNLKPALLLANPLAAAASRNYGHSPLCLSICCLVSFVVGCVAVLCFCALSLMFAKKLPTVWCCAFHRADLPLTATVPTTPSSPSRTLCSTTCTATGVSNPTRITFEGLANADKDLEFCAELTDNENVRQLTLDDDSDTENEEPAPGHRRAPS